jgi:hypothetical protein
MKNNNAPPINRSGKDVKPEPRRSEMLYRILSIKLVLAALVAILMMPVAVMAGGDAAGENAQAVPAENSLEGTLAIVESYGHILIKRDDGHQARLKVRPGAVITRNGKPARLDDLRPGDKVQANYNSGNWVSELNASGK